MSIIVSRCIVTSDIKILMQTFPFVSDGYGTESHLSPELVFRIISIAMAKGQKKWKTREAIAEPVEQDADGDVDMDAAAAMARWFEVDLSGAQTGRDQGLSYWKG